MDNRIKKSKHRFFEWLPHSTAFVRYSHCQQSEQLKSIDFKDVFEMLNAFSFNGIHSKGPF